MRLSITQDSRREGRRAGAVGGQAPPGEGGEDPLGAFRLYKPRKETGGTPLPRSVRPLDTRGGRWAPFPSNPTSEAWGLRTLGCTVPGLSHLEGTLLPPSPAPSHSTGAERKVGPFAKYAKKEGREFSLRTPGAGRERVLPVLSEMGSEIRRTWRGRGPWRSPKAETAASGGGTWGQACDREDKRSRASGFGWSPFFTARPTACPQAGHRGPKASTPC